jgi:hypothetical protein
MFFHVLPSSSPSPTSLKHRAKKGPSVQSSKRPSIKSFEEKQSRKHDRNTMYTYRISSAKVYSIEQEAFDKHRLKRREKREEDDGNAGYTSRISSAVV